VGQPRTLRLAVGPLGSEDARMAAAFVQGLNRDKASIRLRLVLTEGSEDSARKIDAGQADLAMLRADIAMPSTADTVLITRRTFPFFITRAETAIGRIAELRGRKIGVGRNPAGNAALLKRVLAQYEARRRRRSASMSSSRSMQWARTPIMTPCAACARPGATTPS